MKYKIVCFDMDGTLIDETEYIWYTLHRHFGVDSGLVKRWHQMFLDGKVTYEQWFSEDIVWWNKAGARKKDFMEAINKLKLMNGARETIYELKKRGMKLAVISGSLNIVVDIFFFKRPFDYVFVNDIYFDQKGKISGFKVTPYDFAQKATAVKKIAEKENISMSQCVFVGDNYNDIEAVKACGLGISFNSKSRELDRAADIIIKNKNLNEILMHIN